MNVKDIAEYNNQKRKDETMTTRDKIIEILQDFAKADMRKYKGPNTLTPFYIRDVDFIEITDRILYLIPDQEAAHERYDKAKGRIQGILNDMPRSSALFIIEAFKEAAGICSHPSEYRDVVDHGINRCLKCGGLY